MLEVTVSTLTEQHAPRVLPPAWKRLNAFQMPDGDTAAIYKRKGGLRVLFSVDDMPTGTWLHASCSRATTLPSWGDLREVKDLFIGRHVFAVQILPPEKDYVNVHANCLHLWRRLDAPTCPGYPGGGE